MPIVFDLEDVQGIGGDLNGDGRGRGIEGVLDEFFDEGGGVCEGLARAEGADGGCGEGLD